MLLMTSFFFEKCWWWWATSERPLNLGAHARYERASTRPREKEEFTSKFA